MSAYFSLSLSPKFHIGSILSAYLLCRVIDNLAIFASAISVLT